MIQVADLQQHVDNLATKANVKGNGVHFELTGLSEQCHVTIACDPAVSVDIANSLLNMFSVHIDIASTLNVLWTEDTEKTIRAIEFHSTTELLQPIFNEDFFCSVNGLFEIIVKDRLKQEQEERARKKQEREEREKLAKEKADQAILEKEKQQEQDRSEPKKNHLLELLKTDSMDGGSSSTTSSSTPNHELRSAAIAISQPNTVDSRWSPVSQFKSISISVPSKRLDALRLTRSDNNTPVSGTPNKTVSFSPLNTRHEYRDVEDEHDADGKHDAGLGSPFDNSTDMKNKKN